MLFVQVVLECKILFAIITCAFLQVTGILNQYIAIIYNIFRMDYEDLKIIIIRGLILIIPFIVLAIVIVFYIKPKHY
jgi:hypothetical protein